MGRIIFVVGTGTSVGKTAVTALLLEHCIRNDIAAGGLKPFCTGERTDAALLWDLQQRKISISEVNPYFFEKPVSAWTAARLEGKSINLEESLEFVSGAAAKCKLLLVEGAGGLLSPFGEKFSAADLIVRTGAEVILVGSNRLGVLNEALLSVEVLQKRGAQKIKIALVEQGPVDVSHKTNLADLIELLPTLPIVTVPFLENYVPEAEFIRKTGPSLDEVLKKLL